MPCLSRRELLVALSAAAVEACSAVTVPPPAVCPRSAAPRCPPEPLVGGGGVRCEIASFDEVHRARPLVYAPTSDDDIARLFGCVAPGRTVTVRGGGQALYIQSLNDDLVFLVSSPGFTAIGDPVLDETGFHLTTGAGAAWGDVIRKLAPLGLMPPSLVTAPRATVGGTLSSDCLSRMSTIVGKEGEQIRSFTLVTPSGLRKTCSRSATDPVEKALFHAVIGGFGYLGIVTEVTFDLVVARSRPLSSGDNPCVLTRSTRHGPGLDWDALLRELQYKSVALRKVYREHPGRYRAARTEGAVPDVLARATDWSALSIASFLTGSGMAANLLEQRYVDPQPLRPFPSGIYDVKNPFPPAAEAMSISWPTFVELGLDMFPEGEFVDELFGWAFFLGNSTVIAKASAESAGNRLNFTQQSFALPAGSPDAVDTRPTRRFLELLEARLHAADLRPEDIDFLYVPGDEFLMSASRGLTSFVVTISFAELNRQTSFSRGVVDLFRALSTDCRRLGGRVHLVKGVYADRDDLRAMYGDAAGEFRKLKQLYDPKNVLRNEFFEQVFGA